MIVAFDTSYLGYLAGIDRAPVNAAKVDIVRTMQADLSSRVRCCVSTQALGELNIILLRTGLPRERARETILAIMAQFEAVGSSVDGFRQALDLATTHKLQFWDSIILNAAAEAGCAMFLSEDMQHGFNWRGTTVVDPFRADRHPLLAQSLA